MNKEIFDLINKLGESAFNKIHIIQSSYYNCSPPDYLKEYRIYHSDGHCLDISKSAILEDGSGKFLGYEYSIYQEWEGFEEMDLLKLHSELLEIQKASQ